MRVATYRTGTETSCGIIRDEQVSDAGAIRGAPRSVRELLLSADRLAGCAPSPTRAPGFRPSSSTTEDLVDAEIERIGVLRNRVRA